MPIALTEYTQYHPTRLTRQSDNPVMSGTYTLEALTALYGGDNESETLRFAAMQGQAFLKQPKGYVAFNPIPGETSDLPLDVNPGAEAEDDEVEAEVEDDEAEDDEVEAEVEDDEVDTDEVEAEVEDDEVDTDEVEDEADTDEVDTDEVEAEGEGEGDTDEGEAEDDDSIF